MMKAYLDKNAERKLTALGDKRFYKAFIVSIAWEILVLVLWIFWSINSQRAFGDIRTYLPIVFCVIPFYPFKAHKILFSKSFYATVAYTTNAAQFDSLKKAYVSERFRPDVVDVLEVTYEKDDGKKFTLVYKKDKYLVDGLHYDEGDRVFFVRGLKYPMEFPLPEGKDFKCPICGRTVTADSKVCGRCKTDFVNLLN